MFCLCLECRYNKEAKCKIEISINSMGMCSKRIIVTRSSNVKTKNKPKKKGLISSIKKEAKTIKDEFDETLEELFG